MPGRGLKLVHLSKNLVQDHNCVRHQFRSAFRECVLRTETGNEQCVSDDAATDWAAPNERMYVTKEALWAD